MLFDFERCGAHSTSAADPGPIGGYIEDYVLAHPMKKARHIDPPPAPKRPEGCGRGAHDYVRVAGKNYAKCSRCPSTRTVKA